MQRIVILTGAGISAESGLPTFRDPTGFWARYDPRDLATPQAFARDPELVHRFYNQRRLAAAAAQPNTAHRALSHLQQAWPGQVTLVTQNVDDLHECAGSRPVIHIHGRLSEARCTDCDWRGPAPPLLATTDRCPGCDHPGRLRPAVVWFGEIPEHLDQVAAHCAAAELFVSIGTSGTVWPAAGLVDIARQAGAATLEINREPSARAAGFDECRIGPAGEQVPIWVAELLGSRLNL